VKIKFIKEKYGSMFVIGDKYRGDLKPRVVKTDKTWVALVKEEPICFICGRKVGNQGLFCHGLNKFYCFVCEAQEISPCLKFLIDSKKTHIDRTCIIKVEENA